mgnify:CR=1 FL=1
MTEGDGTGEMGHIGLMGKTRTNKPTWSDVKSVAASLDQKQLLALLGDLYRHSRDNQAFLHARFGIGADPLGPYKVTIDECMYPDVLKNTPIQISKAKRAISSYVKAAGDPIGEAELMVFFVECGNSFTLEYGDINEGFYDALNTMYRRSIRKVLSLPEEQQGKFRDRLRNIMESSSGIGWGYHDMLCDDYYNAFPEEE